jgi:SAM-dependent methyltransferase
MKSLNLVLAKIAPPGSDRRMILRVLRESATSPRTLVQRLNPTNFSYWLRYRNHRFDCPVCGRADRPLYDFPNLWLRRSHKIGVLRETLQCRGCFASLRERSLALALLKYLNGRWSLNLKSIAELAQRGLGGLRMLDSDNFSEISRLLRGSPGFARCSYLPEHPWGAELQPGYFNIDLQKISFADESFDIVLTSDVMEHVRDCDAAHAEIFRVLRPGGAYVFNVPFEQTSAEDIQLVDTKTEKDIFLVPPQFHGDPLTGGILAYRVFGRELILKLERLGFIVEFLRIDQPSSLVIDGDVFIARKP